MNKDTIKLEIAEFDENVICEFRYSVIGGIMKIDSVTHEGRDVREEVEELGYNIEDCIWSKLAQ